MMFVCFSLDDFHIPRKDETRVRVRLIEARSLKAAKELMMTRHCGAWSIVSKKAFDRGIIHAEWREGKPL